MQRPLALHNKLFGLLMISLYSEVNHHFLKAGLTAPLGVFMIPKEKKKNPTTKPEFEPLPYTQCPGRNTYGDQDFTAIAIYMTVVPRVSPSAGSLALQPLDPALQETLSPALTQTLLGGQEQAGTSTNP